jgi:hypothetical protein
MKPNRIWLAGLRPLAANAQAIIPLKISEHRRRFVTQQGKPFLYPADTSWQIFTKLTTDEAVDYLSFRKEQGFNTLQVQIAMDPAQTNQFGQFAFHGDVDFARPNEPYHENVKADFARELTTNPDLPDKELHRLAQWLADQWTPENTQILTMP